MPEPSTSAARTLPHPHSPTLRACTYLELWLRKLSRAPISRFRPTHLAGLDRSTVSIVGT